MASPSVDIGTGTATVHTTSGFDGELTSMQPFSVSRGSVDTTHLGTLLARTFAPTDLYDGGEYTVEGHFNPDTNPPVISQTAAETTTITFNSGATCAFSAFWTEYTASVALEDKMTFSATLKITGAITETAAGSA